MIATTTIQEYMHRIILPPEQHVRLQRLLSGAEHVSVNDLDRIIEDHVPELLKFHAQLLARNGSHAGGR